MKNTKLEKSFILEEYKITHTRITNYQISAHRNKLYELVEMLLIIQKDLERWYEAYLNTQVTMQDFQDTVSSFDDHAYNLACNYQIQLLSRHP